VKAVEEGPRIRIRGIAERIAVDRIAEIPEIHPHAIRVELDAVAGFGREDFVTELAPEREHGLAQAVATASGIALRPQEREHLFARHRALLARRDEGQEGQRTPTWTEAGRIYEGVADRESAEKLKMNHLHRERRCPASCERNG